VVQRVPGWAAGNPCSCTTAASRPNVVVPNAAERITCSSGRALVRVIDTGDVDALPAMWLWTPPLGTVTCIGAADVVTLSSGNHGLWTRTTVINS
jgi:hypothetical protein